MAIRLGDLVVRLVGDSAQFEKMIQSATKRLEGAGKKLQAAGAKMTVGVTLPLAALGAASLKAFSDFDDAMTKSTSIMGAMTDSVRKDMEDQAKAISKTSVTAVSKLAESYFFLASAGLNAQESIKALGVVEKFAVAGAFDMATATDLLTDAQSALGLATGTAQEKMENMVMLSDVLIKANTLANASAEQFSKALVTKSAAALRLLKKPLTEGVAVLAAFADQGIKGEQAGEKLSIVLRDLQGASVKSKKEWEALGLSVFDANGKMKPLADIVEELSGHFASLTDEQKKATAKTLGFQARSFSALQTLFGTSEQIRKYEKALKKAGGTTQDVADKQLASFASQMKIMWNQIKLVSIEIGGRLAPIVLKINSFLKQGIAIWDGFAESTKGTIVNVALFAAAIGPVLVALGTMAVVIAGIASTIVAILAPAMLTFIFLAGSLITAIALVIEAFMEMNDAGTLGLKDFINEFRIGGLQIQTIMGAAWLAMFDGAASVFTSITKAFINLKIDLLEISGAIKEGLIGIWRDAALAWDDFQDFINPGGQSHTQFELGQEKIRQRFAEKIAVINNKNLKEQMALMTTRIKLEDDLLATQSRNAATLATLLAKDQKAADKERAAVELAKPKMPDITKALDGAGDPSPADSKGEQHPKQEFKKKQEFKQVSLSRISLTDKSGTRFGKKNIPDKKKQTVEAPKTDKLLERGLGEMGVFFRRSHSARLG